MPYEKQVQKLLSEGINLLPPSDIIAEGEAEKCVNWRPDQAAKLVSRYGAEELGHGFGDWVHDIFVVEAPPANRWYVAGDTKLYHHTATGAAGVEITDAITGGAVPFTNDFFGLASMHGYLWVMNKLRQGRDDSILFYPWLPAAPETAATVAAAAGELSGGVQYYVTFSTAKEYESNPSPISLEVASVTPFGVTLSAIPTSVNPEVTKRHIYRQGGKLPAPYLVRTILDNTTTTVTDDGGTAAAAAESDDETLYFLSDIQAVEAGRVIEDDHDPPPEAFGIAGPYFDRLLAFNSTAHPNRIWWTPSGQPWFFRGSASDDGDWVDVGEDLEAIYAISIKPHMAIIYKRHSVWRLVGDTEDGSLEQITPAVGLRGPRAWTSHGVVDYFRGHEGIYLCTGERTLKISEKIDPIFKGFQSGVVSPTKPLDPTQAYYEVIAIRNDRLYFCYAEVA